jgi:hypothetical protein
MHRQKITAFTSGDRVRIYLDANGDLSNIECFYGFIEGTYRMSASPPNRTYLIWKNGEAVPPGATRLQVGSTFDLLGYAFYLVVPRDSMAQDVNDPIEFPETQLFGIKEASPPPTMVEEIIKEIDSTPTVIPFDFNRYNGITKPTTNKMRFR